MKKKFDSDYLFDLRHKINKEINFKQPRFFILKKRKEEKTSQFFDRKIDRSIVLFETKIKQTFLESNRTEWNK